MLLLVFSFLSFSWEFTKILTYQSRFFSRTQVEQIDLRSNLFMYWPSRAYESLNGYTGNGSFWRYNIGAADACEGCEMPRTTTNARPRPVPNGDQRVVLVVVGVALLFAEEEEEDFTDIKPEERSDLEEVIVKLMMVMVNFCFVDFYLYRRVCFFDL